MATEREKMLARELYDAADDETDSGRGWCRRETRAG